MSTPGSGQAKAPGLPRGPRTKQGEEGKGVAGTEGQRGLGDPVGEEEEHGFGSRCREGPAELSSGGNWPASLPLLWDPQEAPRQEQRPRPVGRGLCPDGRTQKGPSIGGAGSGRERASRWCRGRREGRTSSNAEQRPREASTVTPGAGSPGWGTGQGSSGPDVTRSAHGGASICLGPQGQSADGSGGC